MKEYEDKHLSTSGQKCKKMATKYCKNTAKVKAKKLCSFVE
jgi:hypothetical protein